MRGFVYEVILAAVCALLGYAGGIGETTKASCQTLYDHHHIEAFNDVCKGVKVTVKRDVK